MTTKKRKMKHKNNWQPPSATIINVVWFNGQVACLVLFVNGAHKNNNKKVIKQAKILLSKHLSCVYYTHYIIYYYNLPTKLKITSIHPTSSKYIIINSFPLPHTHTHLFLAFFFCYCFVIIIFYIHIFNTLINNFINNLFFLFLFNKAP